MVPFLGGRLQVEWDGRVGCETLGGAAPRCYTATVPTTRHRLTVTETPVVARRLDLAATRFPDLAGSRQALLLRLTEIAEQALLAHADGGDDSRAGAKRRLLERTGTITPADAEAMLAAREADWQHTLEYY